MEGKMVRFAKSSLPEIRAKIEAGERLTLDDGMLLFSPDVHLNEVGEAGQPGARAEERQLRLLQHQHAPEPDERVRLSLHVLRVSLRSARPEGLPDERRADPRARAGSGRRRLHRNAHRRRPAPPDEIRMVSQPGPALARRISATASEGLDGGRDQLVSHLAKTSVRQDPLQN